VEKRIWTIGLWRDSRSRRRASEREEEEGEEGEGPFLWVVEFSLGTMSTSKDPPSRDKWKNDTTAAESTAAESPGSNFRRKYFRKMFIDTEGDRRTEMEMVGLFKLNVFRKD